MDDNDSLQQNRREQYGKCAAILDVDHDVPGSAAVFDQALTNGLAAIVAATWPGEEGAPRKDGELHLKSASQLLTSISKRCEQIRPGVYAVPTAIGEPEVHVNVPILREGLEQTQPVRHARGTGNLTERHVAALLALDSHVSLGQVSEERRDSDWAEDEVRDRYEQQRAGEYLELIGEEEADRRTALASDHKATHPDELADGIDVVDCPVCGRETLAVQGVDVFGFGHGPGTCLACSYVFSSHAAEEAAFGHMMANHAHE